MGVKIISNEGQEPQKGINSPALEIRELSIHGFTGVSLFHGARLMTEARAREILNKSRAVWHHNTEDGEPRVQSDDWLTAGELEAIAWWLRKEEAKKASATETPLEIIRRMEWMG